MIDAEIIKEAIRLAKRPHYLSAPEIAEKLTLDVHMLRMLFTALRKDGLKIPKNRSGKRKRLIREIKELL